MSDVARAWLNLVAILVIVLGFSAFLTWIERRLLGVWQDRYGPNRVGPFGVLQIVADAIKMLTKEDWVPPFSSRGVFVIAPGIGIVDLNIGLLFFLAMSSLGVYSIVLGGWASDGKYSLLGGFRAAAQMLSYEVFMGLSLMGVVILAGSFDLRTIVAAQENLWFCVPQILGLLTFAVAGIAETRRLPFDLPEAENELIAGFHTEYSGMKFGLFYIGEYIGVTLVSAMIVTLFFGGWLGPVLPPLLWFLVKTAIVIALFILMRASLPRPRYDQLMGYAWKAMLPITLLNLVVTGAIVLARG